MRNLLKKLWADDAGALIAAEFLFVATILVIGTVVGLAQLRDAVNVELTELGNAIMALSQGYTLSGQTVNGGSSATDGSQAIDTPGVAQGPTLAPPSAPSVIDVPPY